VLPPSLPAAALLDGPELHASQKSEMAADDPTTKTEDLVRMSAPWHGRAFD
jgi:hypothetical protein